MSERPDAGELLEQSLHTLDHPVDYPGAYDDAYADTLALQSIAASLIRLVELRERFTAWQASDLTAQAAEHLTTSDADGNIPNSPPQVRPNPGRRGSTGGASVPQPLDAGHGSLEASP